jgi:hypothetical protein
MKNKAPDTRNKLDTQRNIQQPRKKIEIKLKKPSNRVTLGDLQRKDAPLKLSKEKKKSKRQLFKELKGISKTQFQLLEKHGVSLTEYKELRRKRKKNQTKLRQAKHAASAAYKRANGKKKGAKGKTPAPKTTVVVKKAA